VTGLSGLGRGVGGDLFTIRRWSASKSSRSPVHTTNSPSSTIHPQLGLKSANDIGEFVGELLAVPRPQSNLAVPHHRAPARPVD
jgi:hypothetical protein